MLRALIWDVDGTIAETERNGHRIAFNRAFKKLGLAWEWNEAAYGRLLGVAGGKERLLSFMSSQPDAPRSLREREALVARLHPLKNAFYGEIAANGSLTARPGVVRLMNQAREAGMAQGIATTTTGQNVAKLLPSILGTGWRDYFSVILTAEHAARKKPHPQIYLHALNLLNLEAHQCLAIEDSSNGLYAAQRAGIPTLVTPGEYFQEDDFAAAALVCDDLDAHPACRSIEGLAQLTHAKGPRTALPASA